MKKKLYPIFISLILISYFLGVLTYKYQLPPYTQLKIVYTKIFVKPQSLEDGNNGNIRKKILKEYIIKREKLLFSHKILPEIILAKYSPGMNIWVDRGYYNIKNDDKINNLYLIKQNRHNHNDIILNSKKKINIIRILCTINDNSKYSSYKKLNYNLLIIGGSCIHDEVVVKEYEAGKIIIPSGGPIASDPIFISNLSNLNDIKIK